MPDVNIQKCSLQSELLPLSFTSIFEIFHVSDWSEQIANAMVYDMLDYDCLFFDIRFVGLDCKNRKIIGNAGHFLWLNL